MYPDIALCGRSGSGKTTAADYLVSKYNFTHCSTGWIVRQISMLLFQTNSREKLNLLTDTLKKIDSNILLSAALNKCKDNSPIIFDSMRFRSDYKYFKSKNCILIQISSSKKDRLERMKNRGQKHDPKIDENHITEKDLDGLNFDFTIKNDSSIESLYNKIDLIMIGLNEKI